MTRSKLLVPAPITGILLISGDTTKRFTPLTGETAEGRSVTIPDPGHDGPTVVGMAWGKQAGPVLEDWMEPAYLRFVAKHGLFAQAYDAQVYFVPLFVGANKAAYGATLKKFRKSATPEVVDHVVFYKDDPQPYLDGLGMPDKATPYFFVLDREGRVLYRTEGRFSEAKLEAIEAVLLES